MADPAPLLRPSSARNLPEPGAGWPPARSCASATSLDDIIERSIGSIGPAQLFQAFLVSLASLFDAQQTFISVFTDAPPSWHCTTGAATAADQCAALSAPCGLPASAWAWDRPPRASVVSEWSLQCAGPAIAGLPASAYFVGSLVGGLLLGTLADSTLGRKKMLFLSCIGMATAGALAAASPNVWVYSALRFVCGFSRSTIGTSAIVLSTEFVGKRWRGEVGNIGFFCFTFGFLSLPALAYANRNSSWRTLYLWMSIPALVYSMLLYFFVRESPRWLLVRGRRVEAINAFKDIAVSNGRDVLADSFLDLNVLLAGEEESWNGSVDLYSALRLLLEKRWAKWRLAAVMAVAFGIGMTYFGMPLAVGILGTNLYLSVAFNALSELPSCLISIFIVGKINRRGAVLGFTLASGACSVACAFVQDVGAREGLELASFFCACTAFSVVIIYALELFPTCVRNSAQSLVRQAPVLGGAFAPVLVAAARGSGGIFSSFVVFGLVIACCGLFVVCLPETRGGVIYDTLEEQEYREKSKDAAVAGVGELMQ